MDQQTQNAVLTDFTIQDAIDDTISQLKFMPNKNNSILASCGWDSKIRLFNIQYTLPTISVNQNVQFSSNIIFTTALQDPILSMCWQGDTTNIITGCADGTINLIDVNNSKTYSFGKHEMGCKELIWVNSMNILMSGGWDGKLNFWDLRSSNPVFNLDFGKKIYTMSMVYPLLVVGTSDRLVSYFNMNKLTGVNFAPEATFESHLKYQTRKIACFPEGDGYAIGSIEGRVAIKYVDLNKAPEINQETKSMNTTNDFAFRCHRSGDNMSEVYPVNDIGFNPAYGTFTTAGGDGLWIIWDKDSRSRLKQGFLTTKAPMTAIDYSANGDLLAYASGYDWAKGIAYENTFQPKLGVHYCPDADKKKKPKPQRN